MAKHDKPDDDDKKDAGHPETPSTAKSHGKHPEPAGDKPATVEKGAVKGASTYPPSATDRSGEKTDNIPPSKLLPPDVPPEEQGQDELARLRTERQAMATALRGVGLDPEAIARGAVGDAQDEETRKAMGPVKKARVVPAGGQAVEVEYPANAENRETAAIAAYQRKAGIWALPSQPKVEYLD